MKRRTFRAADGRKVRVQMTDEQIAERDMLTMLTAVMPVLVIALFAIAAGLH